MARNFGSMAAPAMDLRFMRSSSVCRSSSSPPPPIAPQRGEEQADVGVIDIMPTTLDYLGLPLLPFFEGTTLRPLAAKEALSSRSLFAEDTLFVNSYAIINKGFKYIGNRFLPADLFNFGLWFVTLRSFYKFRADEVYRVADDLQESVNLLETEAEIASRMRAKLLDHIKQAKVGEQTKIDKDTMERLRSLGYVR